MSSGIQEMIEQELEMRPGRQEKTVVERGMRSRRGFRGEGS